MLSQQISRMVNRFLQDVYTPARVGWAKCGGAESPTVGSKSGGRVSRYTCTSFKYRTIDSLCLETKVLKQLVRDKIDPTRDLGHSDKHGKKKEEKPVAENAEQREAQSTASEGTGVKRNPDGTICEDCR